MTPLPGAGRRRRRMTFRPASADLHTIEGRAAGRTPNTATPIIARSRSARGARPLACRSPRASWPAQSSRGHSSFLRGAATAALWPRGARSARHFAKPCRRFDWHWRSGRHSRRRTRQSSRTTTCRQGAPPVGKLIFRILWPRGHTISFPAATAFFSTTRGCSAQVGLPPGPCHYRPTAFSPNAPLDGSGLSCSTDEVPG